LTVLDLTNNQELRYLDLKRAKLIKEDVKGLDSLLKLHCYIGGDVPSYDTYFGFDDDDDDDVVPLPFDQIKKNFEKDYVFFTGSLEAIDGHEIKYLLRKPVDQGGAGALAADEVDPAAPNTNDLLNDDTDADTSGWNDIEK
jgi:hypothetical protein